MFKRLFWYSPAMVLVVVAAWQIQRAHSSDLTPWKGGGFGMFSTIDQPNARFLKIYLIEDGLERPVSLPSDYEPHVQRVKADPSTRTLDELASKFAGLGSQRFRKWVIPNADDLTARESTGQQLATPPGLPSQLRIEVWRIRFDQDTNEMSSYRFLETTVSLPQVN